MKRRNFIKTSALTALTFCTNRAFGSVFRLDNSNQLFNEIIEASIIGNWKERPIDEVMGCVSEFFLGIPYVAGTLEKSDIEQCVVNLEGLDCVTFFENTLNIARIIKMDNPSYDALLEQVALTRYRDGKINGYTSRLHYTSDWIFDNVNKNVVRDITQELGGEKIKFNLSFMSRNPKYYKQLKNNPEAVSTIRQIEKQINKREYYYIPKSDVEAIESKLLTGDIIAIVNIDKGLDYSHTGLIFKEEDANFMHASTLKKKVIKDIPISKYLAKGKKSNIGITVLRAIEPVINE